MEELVDIYFLYDGHASVKIGKSKDVGFRSSQLQTGNSNELILLGTIKNVPHNFEKHLHEVCQWYIIKGEWFKVEAFYNHIMHHPNLKLIVNLEKIEENKRFFTN